MDKTTSMHRPHAAKKAFPTGPKVANQVRVEVLESIEDGIAILRIKGDIDLHHSPKLRALLRTKVSAKCPALLVNFTEVNYIDSSGIATLVEYYQGCRGYSGKVALAGMNPRVKSVFELVRLHEVFSIFPMPDEALASFAKK